MEKFIPFEKELENELDDKIFKRKLVLWWWYIKKQNTVQISNETGLATSTCSQIIRKWKMTGQIEDINRTGRPTEISENTIQKIIKLQEEDRFRSAKDILRELIKNENISGELENVSYYQVWYVIRRNFKSLYAPYKIILKPQNLQKRLDWIQKHKNWRLDKWKNVVWTDEKIFRLHPQNKKLRVKIKFDENVNDFALPKKQQGGGSIMFWGAISGKGKILLIESKILIRKLFFIFERSSHS